MNLCTKQKHTDLENRLVVSKWKCGREGMEWEFRVSRCANYYVWNGEATRSYSMVQGTLFSVL